MKETAVAIFEVWQGRWKQLFFTDIVYKIIAFVLLTPLVSILFRVLFALSGNTILADQDILIYFLSPLGLFCLVAVGAVAMAIKALEMATLMEILVVPPSDRLRSDEAVRRAFQKSIPVLIVTARIMGTILLASIPFLVVAGAVYFYLLSEHDINFYLKEKPPVFMVAICIGGFLAAAFAALSLRFLTNWFFALQLVQFENVTPSLALSESRNRAVGHRIRSQMSAPERLLIELAAVFGVDQKIVTQ